jgi:hypothetical protein
MYSERTSNIGRCSAGQTTTPHAGKCFRPACSGDVDGGLPWSVFAGGRLPDGGCGVFCIIILYSVFVKQLPIVSVSLFSGGFVFLREMLCRDR